MRCDIKSSEIIFHDFFKIEKTKLNWERFNGDMGKEHTRYVIRRGDSVGIIPVCGGSGRIILVKQFRFPAVREGEEGWLWEIPAGMVDGEEEPLQTARRELFEETGLQAEKIDHLISYYLSPGLLDEKLHLFHALITDCTQLPTIGGNAEEDEDLLLQTFHMDELLQMVKRNEITDAKSIAALLLYICLNR